MQALIRAKNSVTGVDFVLCRGSYYTGLLKYIMAYPTWKFPTNVQRHDPLENIVKCGSKRGRSSISEWGRIEFWVVAMHVIVLQSIEEEN